MTHNYLHKDAELSECGKFRFALSRTWDAALPRCSFIGLNPSTANADLDDPTIRRCVAFAASWGCGELTMVNLFPLRSTDPRGLLGVEYPLDVSMRNWEVLAEAIQNSAFAIAAWGNHGLRQNAGPEILERYRGRLHYLRINAASGQPAHPLYLPKNLQPIRFERAA